MMLPDEVFEHTRHVQSTQISLPIGPTPGHDLGANQHKVEGLSLGKAYTKLQLPSIIKS